MRLQVLRWQRKRTHDQADSDDSSNTARPQIVLTLQSPSEEPAALVVLKALYGVKPIAELLSELSQQQQVQAAVLADMWGVQEVSTAAARLLRAAPELSAECKDTLLQLPGYPECLLHVLQKVLLGMVGDLEAVWADSKLQDSLMSLPLPAMVALLSCDDIKVCCDGCQIFYV